MAIDYGIDVDAVLDWPDPEALASGPLNLANALARRLLTSEGAYLDVGDDEPYACLNLYDWLAARPLQSDITALNTSMQQVLSQDERVATVTASATLANGVLQVAVKGVGSDGAPFDFILTIDAVSTPKLQVNR